MTNHWIDLRNSDVILVMGSNAAANHPISMKWVQKAKDNGGKLISVDPRFTQTSAKADVYAPLRSGTDIAFLGGMIKYILDNNKYFPEYVTNYTNASYIVGDKYRFQRRSLFGIQRKGEVVRQSYLGVQARRTRGSQRETTRLRTPDAFSSF